MSILRMTAGTALSLLMAFPVLAGDFKDFEVDLRSAYASYRAALFMTNTGKTSESAKAVTGFSAAWKALQAQPTPPQYEDDPAYVQTMQSVMDIAARAAEEVKAGALAQAHETLEAIRDEIGSLHIRNGLFSFSDRMNAYHARMEKVLGAPNMTGDMAAKQAEVLEYLLIDLKMHPPTDADDAFKALIIGVGKSIEKLKAAAETGDASSLKAAIGGLKPPYAKLFLKFG